MSAEPFEQQTTEPETAPAGIVCPRCKNTAWDVLETRKRPGRLVRVRTCAGCKLKVRTREVIESKGVA